MVTVAMNGICSSPSIVPGTLQSELSLTMFITSSNDTATIFSLHAHTQALFVCNGGYIGVYLSSGTNELMSVPLQPLLADSRTVQSMAKSLPLYNTGYVWGSVASSDGINYTASRSDIFSSSVSGLFVADTILTEQSTITNLFNNINSALNGPIDVAIIAARDLFSDPTGAYNDYISRTIVPSLRGFLWWFVGTKDELTLSMDRSGAYSLGFELHAASSTNAYSGNINSILAAFLSKLDNFNTPTVADATSAKITVEALLVAYINIDSLASGSVSLASSYSSGRLHAQLSFSTSYLVTEATIQQSLPSPAISDYSLATVNPLLFNVTGYSRVAYMNGRKSFNIIVPDTTSIANNFAKADFSTFPFSGTLLEPLDLTSMCGSATWSQVKNSMRDAILSSTDSLSMATALQANVATLCNAQNTLVDVGLLASGTTELVVSFSVLQIVPTSVTTANTTYTNIFATPRLRVPVVLKTNILFTFGTSYFINSTFISGQGNL